MEYTNNNNIYRGENEAISLRDLMSVVVRRWYWFVISLVLCLAAAVFYLKTQIPAYKRTAVVLVKENNKRAGSTDILAVAEGFGGSGVDNEIYMFRTRMILRSVVEKLHLDVDYKRLGTLRDYPLYKDTPFTVNFLTPYTSVLSMVLEPATDSTYRIVAFNDKECSLTFNYGETVEVGGDKIVVNPVPEYLSAYKGKKIEVTRISVDAAAGYYQSMISTSLASENTTLVAIDCIDSHPKRAEDILSTLVEVYNQSILDDKNYVAFSTATFLDERLAVISKELGEVEDQLTRFKQDNQLVDLSSSASQYLAESFSARNEALTIETEISVANSVKDYLATEAKSGRLIPNVSGVGDNTVQSQINSYNEIMLQRNRLLANSGENNVVIKNMDANLEAMRETISGAIDNYISALNVRLASARSLEDSMLSSIRSVPAQEKVALGIMRQQNIKESLYIYLLQKREETALQMAVSETNIRVIETPVGSHFPVLPVKTKYLMIAVIIGLVLPLGVIIFSLFFNTTIRSRREVEEALSLPLIGEIPQAKKTLEDGVLAVSDDAGGAVAEAFRMLRANLSFLAKDAKVLMFISTLPSEGKTFVSRNLAQTLALSGKRVVLVDTDLRKRTQSILFHVSGNEGLSYYLAGYIDDVRKIIHHKVIGDIDIVPAGAVPPNPSELLMNERFDTFINELKELYDFIILDNVPAQAVADATVVNRVADLTLYVIREGVLDRRALPDIERLKREGKFKNMSVILNGCDTKSGSYGYGYGYYGYHNHGKKSFWQRLKNKF